MTSNKTPIIVVSGLPRSGTSMMMQALDAGGLEILSDGIREADSDNPKGYYELEKIKKLEKDASWIAEAEGKVIKVISMLLYDLPSDRPYKIVFLNRKMEEILASQTVMWKRLNPGKEALGDAEMARHYQRHLDKLQTWLEEQEHMDVLYTDYNAVLADPEKELAAVHAFLGGSLNLDRMIRAVDPALHRQKA